MTTSQFCLGLTFLAMGAYVWHTNARFGRMERDLAARRNETLLESKKTPDQTSAVLTERFLERMRGGEVVSPQGQASASPFRPTSEPAFDPVELRRRADENAEHLQQAVLSETKDPRWDAQAEAEIRKLDEIFVGSKVRTTECRRTMCYIDVVHDDTAALANWSLRAALEPSEAFASRLSIRFAEPDGKVSTKVFLVRKGEELPAID